MKSSNWKILITTALVGALALPLPAQAGREDNGGDGSKTFSNREDNDDFDYGHDHDDNGDKKKGPVSVGNPGTTKSGSTSAANSGTAVAKTTKKPDGPFLSTGSAGGGLSQGTSIKYAIQVSSMGASRAASFGAVACAQGANESLVNIEGGAQSIKECQNYFEAASKMKENEAKLGSDTKIEADKEVLAQPAAQSTLAKFEENFEFDRKEYVEKMLSSRGSRNALNDMLASRFSENQLATAMAAADALPDSAVVASADLNVYNPEQGGVVKTVPAGTREKLRKHLTSEFGAMSRTQASVGESIRTNEPKGEYLTPLDAKVAFATSDQKEDAGELSIFDVVHRKYREVGGKLR